MREVGSSAAQVTRGETASLTALTEDPAQVSRIVDTVTATSDRVMYDLVRDEVRRAGLDDSDANAIDGFIAATYGSEKPIFSRPTPGFSSQISAPVSISLIAGRQSEIRVHGLMNRQPGFAAISTAFMAMALTNSSAPGTRMSSRKTLPDRAGRQAILRGVQSMKAIWPI